MTEHATQLAVIAECEARHRRAVLEFEVTRSIEKIYSETIMAGVRLVSAQIRLDLAGLLR